MMEGPDPTASLASRRFDIPQKENKEHLDEIARLKTLLAAHKIPCEPSVNLTVQSRRRSSRHLTQPASTTLPQLPIEIQLRILNHALTSPHPIIDPFYKLRRDTVTKQEWSRRAQININFLATCKAFHVEGLQLIFSNNTFIFTQAAALGNFTQFSCSLRATVKQVKLRVVGRYYDEVAGKRDLTGNIGHHPSVNQLMIPIIARPPGLTKDKGIQAYCWQQPADFLRALLMPDPPSASRQKLFPGLEFMQIDLVNFCDHLPYGGYQFSSLVRWHVGQIADEILITGAPMDDVGEEGFSNEERVLHQLLRDGGLAGTAVPLFVSISSGLKPLKAPYVGISQIVVRADKEPASKSAKSLIHPEGGQPPKSTFKSCKTIWKWATDSLTNPEKRWIEFHRESGLPADEAAFFESDLWSDLED
jgi:hypothetical protein